MDRVRRRTRTSSATTPTERATLTWSETQAPSAISLPWRTSRRPPGWVGAATPLLSVTMYAASGHEWGGPQMRNQTPRDQLLDRNNAAACSPPARVGASYKTPQTVGYGAHSRTPVVPRSSGNASDGFSLSQSVPAPYLRTPWLEFPASHLYRQQHRDSIQVLS